MSSRGSLEQQIAEVCGQLNSCHGRLVALTEAALSTNAWQGFGFRSPEHWLTIQAGVSHATAARVVAVARRRAELPTVRDALDAGEVTLDQVAVVAAYVPAHNDAEVIGFTRAATVSQLRSTLRRYPFDHPGDDESADVEPADTGSTVPSRPGDSDAAEPDPSSRGVPPDAERGQSAPVGDRPRCGWYFDDNGTFHLHLTADTDDGALIDTALNAARARLHNSGQGDVTNVDAMVEMSNQSLHAAEGVGPLDRTRIHIHLDTDGAFVHQGPRLPPGLAARILCGGVVRPVWETEGLPVNVGRDQRIVPERTRKVVEHRDQTCRYPGCTRQRHLEVHHVVHWLHDGVTDSWNLIALCGGHHRAHHRGEFDLIGNADLADHLDHPDGLVFTRPDGSRIWACQRPIPPSGPPLPPAGRFRHPTGEWFDATLLTYRNRDGTYDPPIRSG